MRVVIKKIGTKSKLEAKRLAPQKKETKRSLRGLTTLDQFLDEDGIKDDATLVAMKRVVALQLSQEMKARHINKTQLAQRMRTSRAQVDRVLDPRQGNITLDTLGRAAKVLGRSLKVKLA
jgi:antitoxin HicB